MQMKTCFFKPKELLEIYPVTIAVGYKQENIYRKYGADINQVFIVTNGRGCLTVENTEYEIEKGDMFFIKKDVPHYYGGNDDFTTSYLGFDGRMSENVFTYFDVNNAGVYKNKNFNTVLAQLEEFYENFDNITEYAILSAYTYKFVSLFFSEALKNIQTPIEAVKRYIESNYYKSIALMDILEFYPYSKATLCRKFAEEYGIGIFEAITKIRLEHAKIMLRSNPSIKLKKVAESCGFNDVSYFCKVYKKAFGESPKKQNG